MKEKKREDDVSEMSKMSMFRPILISYGWYQVKIYHNIDNADNIDTLNIHESCSLSVFSSFILILISIVSLIS